MRYFYIFLSLASHATEHKPDVKQLEKQLIRLEGDIQHQKYYAHSNLLREGAAYTIAIAGIVASITTPKHLVHKNEKKPITTFLRKLSVGTVVLGYTAIGATLIHVTRPILWINEYKRDRLQQKIFNLKAM